MNEDKQKYDPWFPLVRIADAIEEILRLVKLDQEKMQQHIHQNQKANDE